MAAKRPSVKTISRLPGSGDWPQKIRLASGLVLFAFALTHFLNHAAGIFSIDALESIQTVRRAIWRSWPGSALLYAALVLHVALALWKTVRRGTLKMPVWEAVQLVLGLVIPWQLFKHILATRGANLVFGLDDTYTHELSILWPTEVTVQSALLLMVWLHGCIGIHFWLRLRPFYKRIAPTLLGLAVAIPALAQWGWIDAARRLWLVELDEGRYTQEQYDQLTGWISIAQWGILAVGGLTVLILAGRLIFRRAGSRISVQYPGNRQVRVSPGATLLEISRGHGVPHASVCGGRARCSTCRTAILKGEENMSAIDKPERMVLDRIRASENIRLACQARPTGDVEVQPLMPVRETEAAPGAIADAYHWGVEQPVAVLFADIRGFTAISEQRLSYDVVFVLNRYLDSMSRAITEAGGYVDKFIGDGIMAIFGMTDGPRVGCRQALEAAVAMGAALDRLNGELISHTDEPLRIGIGIHAGQAILGRIGAAGGQGSGGGGITALGDTVNTASRLEASTKETKSVLVISRQVAVASGIAVAEENLVEMAIRGRKNPLRVLAFKEFDDIVKALAESDVPVSAEMLSS